MSESKVVTIRMPADLKHRLEREAKYQGVSVNQLTTYLLNIQLTRMESLSLLESRLESHALPQLKKKVSRMLDAVPNRDVPAWDIKE